MSFSYEELGLTQERFERLVRDHVPVFFLDKKEKYGPCSVEWFLERASLVERGKDGPASVFLPRGQVTQEQLLGAVQFSSVHCFYVEWEHKLEEAGGGRGLVPRLESMRFESMRLESASK
eukprot:scaffold156541_cov17-Tisochrysis_lutea.AAC.2